MAAGKPTIVVNDAYKLAPWADVLYATDADWWDVSGPRAAQFLGECWSSHSTNPGDANDKRECAKKHRLRLVNGRVGNGFCFEPGIVHYGNLSGFAAINLALQFGARKVWLLGFDMHADNGRHYFGDHPEPLSNVTNYREYIGNFDAAARMLPDDIKIINATPGSALTCFPTGKLL